MIVNSKEGTWKIGSTTSNYSLEKIELINNTFINALLIFNKEKGRVDGIILPQNEQLDFFNFCNSRKEFKILFGKITTEPEKAVRLKRVFFTNYGLMKDYKLSSLAKNIFLQENNESLLSETLNISSSDIGYFKSLLSIEIKSDEKFNPWVLFFNSLIDQKTIPLQNIYVARYSETQEEFLQILNLRGTDFVNWQLDKINQKILKKTNDRKSSKGNYEEIAQNFISEVKINIEDEQFLLNKYLSLLEENSHKSKLKSQWKCIKEMNILENNSTEEIFLKSLIYQLWNVSSYKTQIRIAGYLTKTFTIFEDSVLISNPLLRVGKVSSDTITLNNKHIKNNETNIGFNIMKQISLKNNILSDLLSEDFYTNETYPNDIRGKRKFVILEYFILVILCKIYNVEPQEMSNMKLYENGFPQSHAPGSGPDIFFKKENIIFEITSSYGRDTEKLEIESVPRHTFKIIRKNNNPDIKTVFIANDPINTNIYSSFISWRKNKYYDDSSDDSHYGMKILTMSITEFEKSSKDKEELEHYVNSLSFLDEEESDKIQKNTWSRKEYDERKKKIFSNKQ